MIKLHPAAMLLACLFIISPATAQESASRANHHLLLPNRFIKEVNNKASLIENNILHNTNKALKQLSKEEAKLRKRISRKDKVLAKRLFQDAAMQYSFLQQKVATNSSFTKTKEYIPFLDTLTTSLQFLQKNATIANSTSLQQTLLSIHKMEDRLQQAKDIQQYLHNRRQYLHDQLSKLNMLKALKQYHKRLYYYQAQIEEYRDIIKQPDKIERKAIELLSKTKPYQEFLANNSIVSAIFGPSHNTPEWVSAAASPGLQTNMQVNEILQQTTGGPNNQQALQSHMQQAKGQLQQVKNKINKMDQSDDDGSMPNFRPNHQRVKSFWQRWELGANLQSTRSSYWLPTATQIGLSAGYKLNDRSVIGIGMAGSVGWGKSIKHIIVSYEGIGARSFIEWKLKGTFWMAGGYEMNYQPSFTRIEQLNTLNKFQQSGLIGISRKYNVGKKMKGNMNLLWDYLSYNQTPRTQPLIFRFGYSLK